MASFLFTIAIFAIAVARVSARSGPDGLSFWAIWLESRVVGVVLLLGGLILLFGGSLALTWARNTFHTNGDTPAAGILLLFIGIPVLLLAAALYGMGKRMRRQSAEYVASFSSRDVDGGFGEEGRFSGGTRRREFP